MSVPAREPEMESYKRRMVLASLALLAASSALALAADARAEAILSTGPLEEIHTSRVLPLDCQVMYAGVDYDDPGAESDGEYWGDDGSSLGPNACGTFLRPAGWSSTFGPNVGGFSGAWNPGNPAPMPFTSVSQTRSGSGTPSDPYAIVTTVDAPVGAQTGVGGALRIEQTDHYIVGKQYYETTFVVTNDVDPDPEGTPNDFTLFRGADCYLEPQGANEDLGDYNFGWTDSVTGAAACTTEANVLGPRFIAWIPLGATRGSVAVEEGAWDYVWDQIGTGLPFTSACVCASSIDGGLGLSWSFTLDIGETATMSVRHLFGVSIDFTTTHPTTCSGPIVRFTPLGWDYASAAFFRWDFGDGFDSTEEAPRHEYAEPGEYQVTLVSTDEFGFVGVARKIVIAGALECCPEPGSGGETPHGCTPPPATAEPQDPVRDTDQDGVADDADNCPGIANKGQTDSDQDGMGDSCDDPCPPVCGEPGEDDFRTLKATHGDQDMDGIADPADNCPAHPNHDQADLDQDTLGDACDADADSDGVAVLDGFVSDNCPWVPNVDQADHDGDGTGDACETEAAVSGAVPRGRPLASSQAAAVGPGRMAILAVLALLGTGALVIGALFVHSRKK